VDDLIVAVVAQFKLIQVQFGEDLMPTNIVHIC
jgi:hypothetical protein